MRDFNVVFSVSNSTDIQCDRVGVCSSHDGAGILNEYCGEFALLYMAEGEITVRMNMNLVMLEHGKMYLVQPETAYSVSGKGNVRYAYWTFDGNLVRRRFLSKTQYKCIELDGRMKSAVRDYLCAEPKSNFYGELKTMAFVLDVLKEFGEEEIETFPDTGAGNEFIDKFVMEVNANYRENITVEKICKQIGISINYFTNYFMRNMRITPRQFIIDVRLGKAKEMLLATNLSIDEIGQYVGYGDAFAFSRAFKKKVGESPSVFRRRQRLGNIQK